MSINDPLIKEIKEWTSKFLEDFNNDIPICDSNDNLQYFCICIEKIFSKGLLQQYSSLGFNKTPYAWTWLEKIDCSNFNYSTAVDIVTNSKNVFTPNGHLRLLIRACLVKKCLHIPIITLIQNPSLRSVYHTNGSIIGDEILVQILLSVLMQCSKFKFQLDLNNSSFLDLAWILPKVVKLELVPCKSLGLSVRYAYEKAVVVQIEQNGVAAEDGNIEIGDVLDELNDVHVCTSSRGTLGRIMKKGIGKPISLKIIKAKTSDTEIYMPIVPLLKHIKIDVQTFGQRKPEIRNNQRTVSAGYNVEYIGSVTTGNSGDVKKIDFAIRLILSPVIRPDTIVGPKVVRVRKEVCFEIGEIGVKCVDPHFGQDVLTHSYMEISSCGSVSGMKHYFAYIAGDDICNIAKNFTCYIFHSRNDDNVATILSSIGQGFLRTHYAV